MLAVVVGLLRDRSAATLNNVAFALFHIVVLSHGVATAIVPSAAPIRAPEPIRSPSPRARSSAAVASVH
jgi:hypothetical protein